MIFQVIKATWLLKINYFFNKSTDLYQILGVFVYISSCKFSLVKFGYDTYILKHMLGKCLCEPILWTHITR